MYIQIGLIIIFIIIIVVICGWIYTKNKSISGFNVNDYSGLQMSSPGCVYNCVTDTKGFGDCNVDCRVEYKCNKKCASECEKQMNDRNVPKEITSLACSATCCIPK